MRVTPLLPGLLVSMNTTLKGNVRYFTRDIESDHLTAEGARQAVWETQRYITDAEEHEAAVKCRSKARGLITGVCVASSFGLLCPASQRERLDAAISSARELVTDFNNRARLSRIGVFVMVGQIGQDDAESIRAINGEIVSLMEAMETGLRNLDVEAVRKAADSARALNSMLSEEARASNQRAIDVARAAARKIVKAGETASIAIDEAVLKTLRESRAAFLDLEEPGDMREPEADGRAVDLAPEDMPPPVVQGAYVPAIEL